MTRFFKPGSTLLAVSYICFGGFLPFLDLIHSCSLSNLHFYCFCQNKYGEEIVRRHAEGFNWRETDIDPMAMYASGGGKIHGRRVTDFSLIMCLCNVMIYSYIIYVAGIPCLMA
jgi:hypothetical protein